MPTSVAIDKNTCRRAQARAAADGISLSSALRLLLAGYAEGRIALGAMPAADAARVDRVADLPMSKASTKQAERVFVAVER